MSRAVDKPYRPNDAVPEEFEPQAPRVEPDEGPVPADIPEDPEHERVIDPDADPAPLVKPARRQVEVAAWP